MTRNSPLIAIVGPTAVGKSALALCLAESLPGEIVSADSRQIYRGLDIGTAKVTPEGAAAVPARARTLAEEGEIGQGMLWLAAALRAIEGSQSKEHKDIEKIIRT